MILVAKVVPRREVWAWNSKFRWALSRTIERLRNQLHRYRKTNKNHSKLSLTLKSMDSI